MAPTTFGSVNSEVLEEHNDEDVDAEILVGGVDEGEEGGDDAMTTSALQRLKDTHTNGRLKSEKTHYIPCMQAILNVCRWKGIDATPLATCMATLTAIRHEQREEAESTQMMQTRSLLRLLAASMLASPENSLMNIVDELTDSLRQVKGIGKDKRAARLYLRCSSMTCSACTHASPKYEAARPLFNLMVDMSSGTSGKSIGGFAAKSVAHALNESQVTRAGSLMSMDASARLEPSIGDEAIERTLTASKGNNDSNALAITIESTKSILPFMNTHHTRKIANRLLVAMQAGSSDIVERASNALVALLEQYNNPEHSLGVAKAACVAASSVVQNSEVGSLGSQAIASLVNLLTVSMLHFSSAQGSGEAAKELVNVTQILVDKMEACDDTTIEALSEGLMSIINRCINPHLINEAEKSTSESLNGQGQEESNEPGQDKTALVSVIQQVKRLLSTRYAHRWEYAFQITECLLDRLGEASNPLLNGLILSTIQAAESRAFQLKDKALLTSALSSAFRWCGPSPILSLAPLNPRRVVDTEMNHFGGKGGEEEEGGNEHGGGRMWLMTIMKRSIAGSRLDVFEKSIVPIIDDLEEMRRKGELGVAKRAKGLQTEMWSLFSSFANFTTDIEETLPRMVERIKREMQRNELLVPISRGFMTMCDQNREVARGSEMNSSDAPPPNFTAQLAEDQVQALRAHLESVLPLLFDIHNRAIDSNDTNSMSVTLQCINAISKVTSTESNDKLFKRAVKKISETGEGKRKEGETERCNLMDVTLAVTAGISDDALPLALRASEVAVMHRHSSATQKRGYRLLSCVCSRITAGGSQSEAEGESMEEAETGRERVFNILEGSKWLCKGPARRHRLRCISDILPFCDLNDDNVHRFIIELVLASNEMNNKTRDASLSSLVHIASHFESKFNDGSGDGIKSVFNSTITAIAGESEHTISAGIRAASRLGYEFTYVLAASLVELLPSVICFLSSGSAEAAKASIGFMKVLSVRLPDEMLNNALPSIMPAILRTKHLNKIRSKAKSVVSASLSKCGDESMEQAVPKEHMPLLRSIQKEKKRTGRAKGTESGSQPINGSKQSSIGFSWKPSRREKSKASMRATSAASSKGFTISPDLQSRGAYGKGRRRGTQMGSTDQIDLLDESTMRNALVPTTKSNADPKPPTEDGMSVKQTSDGKVVVTDDGDKQSKRKGNRTDTETDAKRKAGELSKSGQRNKQQGKARPETKSAPSARASKGKREEEAKPKKRKKQEEVSARRFKKNKAGGDVQQGGVEPFAYWPMDTKLLNRRASKSKEASKNLSSTTNLRKQPRLL